MPFQGVRRNVPFLFCFGPHCERHQITLLPCCQTCQYWSSAHTISYTYSTTYTICERRRQEPPPPRRSQSDQNVGRKTAASSTLAGFCDHGPGEVYISTAMDSELRLAIVVAAVTVLVVMRTSVTDKITDDQRFVAGCACARKKRALDAAAFLPTF